jgi:hypothetical protein
MAIDVDRAVKELGRMTVTELRERYAEVFGEPTRSFHKQHLVRRIAWRTQALQEGDLSERARRRAMELANDADLRVSAPQIPTPAAGEVPGSVMTSPFRIGPDDRLPMPGTLLKREYRGQTIQVRVLPKGFEFEGEVYRSLSAVARKVTGAHWNGYHFFRMPKPDKEATGR